MSANLFSQTKTVRLTVFAGVVTVGSWVASQTTSETHENCLPKSMPSHSEFQLNCTPSIDLDAPHNRESTFVADSTETATPVTSTSGPTSDLDVVVTPKLGASASCCGSGDSNPRSAEVEFLKQASLDLTVAGIGDACASGCVATLGEAAETGCRLFNQLAGTVANVAQPVEAAPMNSNVQSEDRSSVITVSNEQTLPQVAEPALLTRPVRQPTNDTIAKVQPESTTDGTDASECESDGSRGSTHDETATDGLSTVDPTTTCHLKNRKTNEPVATLSIAATNTEPLTEEELAASNGGGSSLDASHLTPMVQVSQNEYTQAWQVEAKNIEMATLLQQLNEHCNFDIVCGDDVNGTVSARVSAHSMDEVLHRLVVPFGLNLRRDGESMIVGSFTQPQLTAPALATNDTGDGDLNRLPPVAEANNIEPVSLVRRIEPVKLDESEMRIAASAKQLIAQGNTAAAQELIAHAIQERPQSAYLYRILGEAFAFHSELENSATALERSIKLNKYDPLTSQIFSEVLARMGQERRAKHYAQLSKDVASGLMSP